MKRKNSIEMGHNSLLMLGRLVKELPGNSGKKRKLDAFLVVSLIFKKGCVEVSASIQGCLTPENRFAHGWRRSPIYGAGGDFASLVVQLDACEILVGLRVSAALSATAKNCRLSWPRDSVASTAGPARGPYSLSLRKLGRDDTCDRDSTRFVAGRQGRFARCVAARFVSRISARPHRATTFRQFPPAAAQRA